MPDKRELIGQINDHFIIFIRNQVQQECLSRTSHLQAALDEIKVRLHNLEVKVESHAHGDSSLVESHHSLIQDVEALTKGIVHVNQQNTECSLAQELKQLHMHTTHQLAQMQERLDTNDLLAQHLERETTHSIQELKEQQVSVWSSLDMLNQKIEKNRKIVHSRTGSLAAGAMFLCGADSTSVPQPKQEHPPEQTPEPSPLDR